MRRASSLRSDISGTGNLLGTRIPLVSLRQTLAVAQYLSFRQAAIALGVSQSSVSARIKTLEADLGIMLFERNTRGVRLTEAGRRFVAEVEQAMRILDRAVKTAGMHARGEQGVLRIGVYALVAGGFLDTLLEHFRMRHEHVALEIAESTALDAQLQVREDRLDIAFMGRSHDIPDLNSRVIWRDRLMAVMPASHPLAAREHIEWQDLAGETFIVREAGTGPQVHDLILVTPKRDYYCQSRRGNRLFELGLSEVGLALCAASAKSDQAAIARILAEHGRDGFLAAWLRHRGVAWAADLIPDLTNLAARPDSAAPEGPTAEETLP